MENFQTVFSRKSPEYPEYISNNPEQLDTYFGRLEYFRAPGAWGCWVSHPGCPGVSATTLPQRHLHAEGRGAHGSRVRVVGARAAKPCDCVASRPRPQHPRHDSVFFVSADSPWLCTDNDAKDWQSWANFQVFNQSCPRLSIAGVSHMTHHRGRNTNAFLCNFVFFDFGKIYVFFCIFWIFFLFFFPLSFFGFLLKKI